MNVTVKFKVNSRRLYSKWGLLFVSLLFMMVLVFSGFISMFGDVSPFVCGASNNVLVSNETDLKNAVNNASGPTTL